MRIMQKLIMRLFLMSIAFMSAQVHASLDTKHRAELTATTSAGSAGSAASASTATAAMPISGDNKTTLERAVDAGDVRSVRAHAKKLSSEPHTA